MQSIFNKREVQNWVEALLRSLIHPLRSEQVDISSEDFRQSRLDESPFFLSSIELVSLASEFADRMGIKHLGIEDLLLARKSFEQWVTIVEKTLQEPGLQHGFFSSGTRKSSSHSTHALQTLLSEVKALEQVFSPVKRVVSLISLSSIYGFIWAGIMPALLKKEVVYGPVDRLSPERTIHPGDLVVASPYHLRHFTKRLPSNCRFLLSGMPMETKDEERCKALNVESFVELFGSTETAGLGYRVQGESAFQLFPHLQQKDGNVFLESKQLSLQDQLSWKSGTSFVPMGRVDDVVQLGAKNYSLSEIESEVKRLHSIDEVKIIFQNQKLQAKVSLRPGEKANIPDWRKTLHENSPELPQISDFVIEEKLEKNSLGKIINSFVN